MPTMEELLSTLFPEGSEITPEQADAISGIRSQFSELQAKNDKNSKWIHDHLFAKPGAEKSDPDDSPSDDRPQYEKDYDYYLAHPGDYSHLINPPKSNSK